MPDIDRDRLAKLLALTTSTHDGEALAATRKANELLRRARLTWADVIEPPAPPPHQAHRQAPDDEPAEPPPRRSSTSAGSRQADARAEEWKPAPRSQVLAWRVRKFYRGFHPLLSMVLAPVVFALYLTAEALDEKTIRGRLGIVIFGPVGVFGVGLVWFGLAWQAWDRITAAVARQ